MDNETRIKLLEAGYTKEEIEAGEPKTDEASKKKVDEVKEKSDEAKENSNDAGEINYKEMFEKLTASVDSLKSTVEAMQDKNKDSADSGAAKKDTVLDTINSFIKDM